MPRLTARLPAHIYSRIHARVHLLPFSHNARLTADALAAPALYHLLYERAFLLFAARRRSSTRIALACNARVSRGSAVTCGCARHTGAVPYSRRNIPSEKAHNAPRACNTPAARNSRGGATNNILTRRMAAAGAAHFSLAASLALRLLRAGGSISRHLMHQAWRHYHLFAWQQA